MANEGLIHTTQNFWTGASSADGDEGHTQGHTVFFFVFAFLGKDTVWCILRPVDRAGVRFTNEHENVFNI